MKALNLVSIFSAISLPFCIAIAQPRPPDSLWSRTYGPGWCCSGQQALDSGYVIAGTRGAGYGADFMLTKTDANGDSLRMRLFGTDRAEVLLSLQQTSDGGYILGGYSYYSLFTSDMWLIKVNANGDSLWGRSYRGVYDENICYSVEQTADAGYILGGCTGFSDIGEWGVLLVKTDSVGNPLWTQHYWMGFGSVCKSIRQTSDGGYVVAGYTSSEFHTSRAKFLLMKTNENGDTLWTRTFGGEEPSVCYSVEQMSDGGYILAGYTESYGAGYADFWLLKTNENGDSLWSRTYGGPGADACHSLQQTSDGGYILAGSTGSFGAGNADFWLVKVDSTGYSLWDRTFGGIGADECYSVQQTSDGGYILAGNTFPPGSYCYQTWVVKTGPELAAEPLKVSLPAQYTLYPNWPNPFNPSTRIAYDLPKTGHVTLTVFDILGKEVTTLVNGMQTAGNHTTIFDGSHLPSGIYFCRLQAGNFADAKKMVLLR